MSNPIRIYTAVYYSNNLDIEISEQLEAADTGAAVTQTKALLATLKTAIPDQTLRIKRVYYTGLKETP
jgi:hypothetical protein